MFINKTAIKITIFICGLFFLSPLYVDYFWSYFTVDGWLGIGQYQNDLSDGFWRSFLFSLFFLPMFYAITISTMLVFKNNLKIINNQSIYITIIVFLSFLFIIAFTFKLGITGVETATEYKLSGLTHYFRAYLAPMFIALYLSTFKPSLNLIFIYSLIAGLTAGSRFVGATPLILYFIFTFLNKSISYRMLKIYSLLYIVLIFSLVTFSRSYLYSEDSDLNILMTFDKETIEQILNQIFLRTGLGRDVILSYEVFSTGICNDCIKFFLTGHSCANPPLDFYGLYLDSHQFYLAAPTLANFYVLNTSFFLKVILYLLFMFYIVLGAKLLFLIGKENNFLYLYTIVSWLLSVIFILIGPLLFYNYLFLLNAMLFISIKSLKSLKS